MSPSWGRGRGKLSSRKDWSVLEVLSIVSPNSGTSVSLMATAHWKNSMKSKQVFKLSSPLNSWKIGKKKWGKVRDDGGKNGAKAETQTNKCK